MPFQESAESLKAKLHLGSIRTPVLVGITAAVLLVLGCAGKLLLDSATGDGFFIERTSAAEAASQVSDENQGAQQALMRNIFVHVSGAVAAPGVYELPEKSRVNDAVQAAGGFVEEAAADACNLAREATDGEHIIVPTLVELQAAQTSEQASGAASGGSSSKLNGLININTATAADLDALPGVGASTAEKIVADREANGPFKAKEDLKRVSGIGEKKYASLADEIRVG